jgi:23S rRNA (adenine-N6)-dimethyltransferase
MPKNRKAGIRPPVRVSQNFLTSSKTINRIVRTTTLNKNDHVIEIGPGKGHITSVLVQYCGRVSAIEIDGRLYQKLRDKFKDTKNIKLYHQDFLEWQLPKSGNYKVFSNIPFYITTDILRKLTECDNPPTEAWLTMEKGAAKRFLGKPSETLRSLLLKPFFDMEITYYFQREDFHPKPGVDVVLFHMKEKRQPDLTFGHRKAYMHFVETAWKYGFHRLFTTKKQLSRAFREARVQNDVTPEEMLYVQWLCLFRCYWHHVLVKR